ncbi:hypothetical protein MRB53_020327 [Persea americana]|uniref:Uncharacterized protein n=1 Tax=Persea americana TaxID=3435 RepID=A0ACC2L162_PERAE|nr:hypothetical protein MRB53_020327 [Persea americana]
MWSVAARRSGSGPQVQQPDGWQGVRRWGRAAAQMPNGWSQAGFACGPAAGAGEDVGTWKGAGSRVISAFLVSVLAASFLGEE